MAGAGNDQALHVVRDELHRVRDVVAEAHRAADRQHGHGQPLRLALRVLRDRGIERSVKPEAAAQGVGIGESTDVVLDHVGRELLGGGVELPAEEDVLASRDELFVQLLEPVERQVPEPVVDRPGEEQGRGGRRPRGSGNLGEGHALDPLRVIRGERVADREAGVVADHGEPLVAERVHQRDKIARERAGVVAARGFVGQPDPALVDRDDLEVLGQRRHQQPPRVPGLGPAVHQQQRRPLAADDRVQAQLTGVDVLARERVREPRGEVRRAGDGEGALRRGWPGRW